MDKNGIFVDGTIGTGGHAEALLLASAPDGIVVGIDQDDEALETSRLRLRGVGARLRLIHGNFADIDRHLESAGIQQVNGIVFDVGVSSDQLGNPDRGFSFQFDGPLDMRMDRRQLWTAATIVNEYPEGSIERILREYGEERYSRRIARAIITCRRQRPIETTRELKEIVRQSVPSVYRVGRLHYATRTFQALRIAVNHELDALSRGVRNAASMLAPGGRLCVISFHSLEDRVVKQQFRTLERTPGSNIAVLLKKPIVPSAAERRQNPRARSAKLRVAERVSP